MQRSGRSARRVQAPPSCPASTPAVPAVRQRCPLRHPRREPNEILPHLSLALQFPAPPNTRRLPPMPLEGVGGPDSLERWPGLRGAGHPPHAPCQQPLGVLTPRRQLQMPSAAQPSSPIQCFRDARQVIQLFPWPGDHRESHQRLHRSKSTRPPSPEAENGFPRPSRRTES